jgi:Protein of unknown function (DUF2459)
METAFIIPLRRPREVRRESALVRQWLRPVDQLTRHKLGLQIGEFGGGTRKALSIWCAILLSCTLSACSAARDRIDAATPDSLRSIYVVRRGWHTGVAIAAADWPHQNWDVLSDFPGVEYLEFGWGDERFYQAETNTVWSGMRAGLFSTSSVIHVIGLSEPTPAAAEANEVVEVRVAMERLRKLAASIEREFADAYPTPTGATLNASPAPNRFYKAQRRFYFPRMCNWWIAARLAEAGCPVEPWTVMLASRVIREANECANGAPAVR